MAITLSGNGTSTFSNNITSSTGNLTLGDGNLVVAAGHGIDFSASSNLSGMTSELLADYEEGTWTPAISVNGFSQSIDSTIGRYVRNGNLVWVSASINLSAKGFPTTYSQMNLPISNTIGQTSGIFCGANPAIGVQGGSILVAGANTVFWYPSNGSSGTTSENWHASITYRA